MIDFQNVVVAGTKLVRDAIQSPNYVTGVSGWTVNQDGSVEFNDGVFRGSLIAGGGNVLISSSGIRVVDTGGTVEYLMNRTGGFVARNVPDNGAISQLVSAQLTFVPNSGNPTPNGHTLNTRARASSTYLIAGVQDIITLDLVSGAFVGQDDSNIQLRSASSDGGVLPYVQIDTSGVGTIENNALYTTIAHRLYSTNTGMDYPAAQIFQTTLNILAADTTRGSGLVNWPVAFPAGATVYALANYRVVSGGLGALPFWSCRMKQATASQYEVYAYSNGPAAGANQTMTIDIVAFVVPT